MRKTVLALALSAGVVGAVTSAAQAQVFIQVPGLGVGVGNPFFFGGRDYCWYDDGWRGPGWYWCGYGYRSGFGWGGGEGWRGWSGHRYEHDWHPHGGGGPGHGGPGGNPGGFGGHPGGSGGHPGGSGGHPGHNVPWQQNNAAPPGGTR